MEERIASNDEIRAEITRRLDCADEALENYDAGLRGMYFIGLIDEKEYDDMRDRLYKARLMLVEFYLHAIDSLED